MRVSYQLTELDFYNGSSLNQQSVSTDMFLHLYTIIMITSQLVFSLTL